MFFCVSNTSRCSIETYHSSSQSHQSDLFWDIHILVYRSRSCSGCSIRCPESLSWSCICTREDWTLRILHWLFPERETGFVRLKRRSIFNCGKSKLFQVNKINLYVISIDRYSKGRYPFSTYSWIWRVNCYYLYNNCNIFDISLSKDFWRI